MSFSWMKIYRSPFKRPKIKFYFGKIAVGTPYMPPRRWVKDGDYLRPIKSWWFKLDFVGLGYKTKYTEFNYRHEWDPIWSLVLFGRQFAVQFTMDHRCWESWLVYNNCTDGSVKDRLKKCQELNPNVWVDMDGNKTDYFKESLK